MRRVVRRSDAELLARWSGAKEYALSYDINVQLRV